MRIRNETIFTIAKITTDFNSLILFFISINMYIGKNIKLTTENVKGSPKQAFIKSGEQRIGSFLLWGDNPGSIKLNPAGKFWLHNLIEGGE